MVRWQAQVRGREGMVAVRSAGRPAPQAALSCGCVYVCVHATMDQQPQTVEPRVSPCRPAVGGWSGARVSSWQGWHGAPVPAVTVEP